MTMKNHSHRFIYSSGETYDELGQVKRIFNNPTAYKYYRIVILDIYAPSTSIINHSCAIQELMFLESDETQYVSTIQFNDLYQQMDNKRSTTSVCSYLYR